MSLSFLRLNDFDGIKIARLCFRLLSLM